MAEAAAKAELEKARHLYQQSDFETIDGRGPPDADARFAANKIRLNKATKEYAIVRDLQKGISLAKELAKPQGGRHRKTRRSRRKSTRSRKSRRSF